MKNILILLSIYLLLSCNSKQQENKLLIATAANMQYVMKELAMEFSKESGIECELIIGSSGKLYAQIMEGAPYQIFVSADMKYPQALYDQGYSTNLPKIYGYGKLVLWTVIEDIEPSIELLKSPSISHIAMANPQTAPYGKAAQQVLNHYDLLETVNVKLVFGESISQTNQFIISQAAQLGFTAKSVVLSPTIRGRGKWINLDPSTYSPIAQGIVVLNPVNESKSAQSQAFVEFVLSAKGQKLLESYGYDTIR